MHVATERHGDLPAACRGKRIVRGDPRLASNPAQPTDVVATASYRRDCATWSRLEPEPVPQELQSGMLQRDRNRWLTGRRLPHLEADRPRRHLPIFIALRHNRRKRGSVAAGQRRGRRGWMTPVRMLSGVPQRCCATTAPDSAVACLLNTFPYWFLRPTAIGHFFGRPLRDGLNGHDRVSTDRRATTTAGGGRGERRFRHVSATWRARSPGRGSGRPASSTLTVQDRRQ